MDEQEGTEKRRRSYRSGAKIAKERMAREAPLDAEALAAVEASDVVVVPGAYDHVDRVLGGARDAVHRVGSAHLGAVELRPEQLLVVNCPGSSPRATCSGSATS